MRGLLLLAALCAGSPAHADPAGPFAFVPPGAEPGRSPGEVVASLLEPGFQRRASTEVRLVEALWYVPERSALSGSPCPSPGFDDAWVALAYGRFSISGPAGPRAFGSAFDRACLYLGERAFGIRAAPGAERREHSRGRRLVPGR